MQTQFRNAREHAEAMLDHASAAAANLAGGAQSTMQQAGGRLADWAERGQHAADLGSRKVQGLMAGRPLLGLVLGLGAGAVVTYMLMRRYGYANPQTSPRSSAQNAGSAEPAPQAAGNHGMTETS